MSTKHAAKALFLAVGLTLSLPAAAAPISSSPSCGDEKHGDGEKDKEKNPSVASTDPSCGDEKHGDGDKDKEKNPSVASSNPSCGGEGDDKKDHKKGDDQV